MHTVRINIDNTPYPQRITLTIISHDKLSPSDALSRFHRSIRQWLANTDVGKASWEARHQFNYGDFVVDAVARDPEFRRFLVTNGLTSAVVHRVEAVELGEHWDRVFEPEG